MARICSTAVWPHHDRFRRKPTLLELHRDGRSWSGVALGAGFGKERRPSPALLSAIAGGQLGPVSRCARRILDGKDRLHAVNERFASANRTINDLRGHKYLVQSGSKSCLPRQNNMPRSINGAGALIRSNA